MTTPTRAIYLTAFATCLHDGVDSHRSASCIQ